MDENISLSLLVKYQRSRCGIWMCMRGFLAAAEFKDKKNSTERATRKVSQLLASRI